MTLSLKTNKRCKIPCKIKTSWAPSDYFQQDVRSCDMGLHYSSICKITELYMKNQMFKFYGLITNAGIALF
jgi:hypothetical protein